MRVMLGAVISLPPFSAGMAWHWLQFAAGLRELGHEVHYVEEVEPDWCVDATGRRCGLGASVNRLLFREVMDRFGLLGSATQLYNGGESTEGLPLDALADLARETDLLINMSGHVKTPAVLGNVRRRAYVDQDPVYTQLWSAEYGVDLRFAHHDVFFSVGLNIGTPRSPIPDCGRRWHPLLPPLVLSHWPVGMDPSCTRFTTIASLRSFRPLSFRGESYGSKEEEFGRFAALPEETGQEFEAALRRHSAEEPAVRLLLENGWHLSEASELAELSRYQAFIARSRGEIGIAKNAYVKSRSGWFSDRAAHYLASGKPVLAQSTGFEECLPVGCGLLTFRSMQEAVAGIHAINRDYPSHCRAARQFAEEFLDHRKVLPRMLELATAERARTDVGQTWRRS